MYSFGKTTNINLGLPKHLPAYGKALQDRIKWKNKPSLVIIEVGKNGFQRAKNWQRIPNYSVLVLGHDQLPAHLDWRNVNGLPCLIEWIDTAPSHLLIIQLVKCLLGAGASSATVSPLFVDMNQDAVCWDKQEQQWIKLRESIKTYYPKKLEAPHVFTG